MKTGFFVEVLLGYEDQRFIKALAWAILEANEQKTTLLGNFLAPVHQRAILALAKQLDPDHNQTQEREKTT